MKARNFTKRIATTIITLTLVAGITYGQGRLVEGAASLLKNLKQKEQVSGYDFVNASYTATNDRFTSLRNVLSNIEDVEYTENDFENRNSELKVLKSFSVNNIDVAYETELKTEEWMTESFTTEIETTEVETWMTVPFSSELEESIETEAWMTESFSAEFEENINTESWMTEAFYNELESDITLEDWMSKPFQPKSFEADIKVEAWMTTIFSNNTEESILVEDWMLTSFIN